MNDDYNIIFLFHAPNKILCPLIIIPTCCKPNFYMLQSTSSLLSWISPYPQIDH